ncbi:MAG: hypothetical protein QM726_21695 [Chitinophagaceae bacterium]
MTNRLILPVILISIALLSWCVYRDNLVESQGTGDLVNRVVGARLQKDGYLPYFYKWKNTDSGRYRYIDPSPNLKVTSITASPAFHRLLYPIADLPMRSISKIWLIAEYICFLTCCILAWYQAKTVWQKLAVVVCSLLFLFTEGWLNHVQMGQLYIIIPFLATLFYACLQRKDNLILAFLAGTFALLLLQVRANAVFFFIPFLFLVNQFSRSFLLVFLLPAILFCFYFAFSKHEQALWKNYSEAVVESVKLHQDLHPTVQATPPADTLTEREGWTIKEESAAYKKYPFVLHSEQANVFVIARQILHVKIPVIALQLMSLFCVLALGTFFFVRHKQEPFDIVTIALLGYCFYMISDLFSPIYRWQYYTMQWLFPLLLAAATAVKKDKWPVLLMCAGLLLNIVNTSLIKMEHSIGEYLILIGLILFVLTKKTRAYA